MKSKSLLLLAGGVGAAYLVARTAFNTGSALKRLTWSNPKVTFKKVGILNSELLISLDIYNPSSADVALDYFTGIVGYNGKAVSNFTFNANGKNTIIKARQTSAIPFTVIVKNVNTIATIVSIAKQLTQGKKIPSIINVTGSLFAAGWDVPVKFNYDVKTGTVVPEAIKKAA
jgi:hypothetical protein